MSLHKLQIGFFLALTVAVLILTFFVFAPLFTVVFLSIIFAVVFHPLHKRVEKMLWGRKTIAAIASTLGIMIVIIVPLVFLGSQLIEEALNLYETTVEGSSPSGALETSIMQIEGFLNSQFGTDAIKLDRFIDVGQQTQRLGGWIVNNVSGVFSGLLKGVFGIVLLILSLFYLLRDGNWFIDRIRELSPLEDGYDMKVLAKLKLAINSVIRGHIIIGIIQGLLAGLGLWIFGVPNPVIWGFIAAIASLIPTVGTGLVLVPAILFVLFMSGLAPALGLTAWGLVVVGLVDNLIGPKLIERGIKIHPFVILLSVLGGLQLFGPIGFIAGPVVTALLLALLEIYPMILEPAGPENNHE